MKSKISSLSTKDSRFSKKFNKQKGNLGEEIACKFLMKHGFTVIIRNYLKRFGEVDIVAKKAKMLHFIEVKTVTHETVVKDGLGKRRPEDNVSNLKIRKIEKAIVCFLDEFKVSYETPFQIDLITVALYPEERMGRVNYFSNINL
jgi:putative endonuclease